MNPWIVVVTIAALLFYFSTSALVARGRIRHGVAAPAMNGPPELERLFRIQGNTLEWIVIFLPCLWMCAGLWSAAVAAWLGVLWIVGRVLYALGYAKEAKKRSPGFFIQALAVVILMLGALAGAIGKILAGGG